MFAQGAYQLECSRGVVKLLHRVHQHADESQMPASNLAIVFAPVIFRLSSATMEAVRNDLPKLARFLEGVITQPHLIPLA
jgi:RhoGAP domain